MDLREWFNNTENRYCVVECPPSYLFPTPRSRYSIKNQKGVETILTMTSNPDEWKLIYTLPDTQEIREYFNLTGEEGDRLNDKIIHGFNRRYIHEWQKRKARILNRI